MSRRANAPTPAAPGPMTLPPDDPLARYHRQALLGPIGQQGQRRLAAARALLVGCGALGAAIADQLVRAGVGHLTVVDRDIVELTNLQRQTLFAESDAAAGLPKAVAAAGRLRAVNSAVEVVPVVADVHSGNVEDLLDGRLPGQSSHAADLILDGTDNVQTRYLLNDLAVKRGVPWVYGAAVGTEGRVMPVRPGATPCLRCVFPRPPSPHDLATCDTAGVLGAAAAIVGAAQAAEAIKLLSGNVPESVMLRIDLWPWRLRVISLAGARDPACPCCGRRQFEFLDAPPAESTVTLCGRNAVQVRPATPVSLSLEQLAGRLAGAAAVERTPHLIRARLLDPPGITLTIFPDGRSLIQGTSDLARARSLHARFVGA